MNDYPHNRGNVVPEQESATRNQRTEEQLTFNATEVTPEREIAGIGMASTKRMKDRLKLKLIEEGKRKDEVRLLSPAIQHEPRLSEGKIWGQTLHSRILLLRTRWGLSRGRTLVGTCEKGP